MHYSMVIVWNFIHQMKCTLWIDYIHKFHYHIIIAIIIIINIIIAVSKVGQPVFQEVWFHAKPCGDFIYVFQIYVSLSSLHHNCHYHYHYSDQGCPTCLPRSLVPFKALAASSASFSLPISTNPKLKRIFFISSSKIT